MHVVGTQVAEIFVIACHACWQACLARTTAERQSVNDELDQLCNC